QNIAKGGLRTLKNRINKDNHGISFEPRSAAVQTKRCTLREWGTQNREDDMTEDMSRRRALSVLALGSALSLVLSTALTPSDAEAETVGMERRQTRRTGRHQRRHTRRTGQPAAAPAAAPAGTAPAPQ